MSAPSLGVLRYLGSKLRGLGGDLGSKLSGRGGILALSWKDLGACWLQVGRSGRHFGHQLGDLGSIFARIKVVWG